MKKKMFVFVIFFILFIALAAIDVKVTLDAHDTVVALRAVEDGDEASQELLKDWKEFNRDRLVNCGIVLVYFVIIGVLVANAGPSAKKKKHISPEKADEYIRQIEAEYEKKDLVVEASGEDEEDLITELDKPVLKPLQIKKKAVVVSWNKVEHADGYTVYRKIGKEKWKKLGSNVYGVTKYEDLMIESDTTYLYTVRAFMITDEKRVTSKIDTLGKEIYIKDGNIPPIPDIHVAYDELGRQCIGWDEIEGVRSYRIYRKDDENGKWKKIDKVLSGGRLYYYDEALSDGKARYYSVRAANSIYKHAVVGDFNREGILIEGTKTDKD